MWLEANAVLLLDAAPDAILVSDEAGCIVLANLQAERLFGVSRDKLVGLSVESLIPTRFRDQHPQHRKNFLADPRVRPMGAGLELFAQRSDGNEFPVEISLSPLKTGQGTFVISAIRDTSERRRAEERFHGLMESAPDAMVIVDQKGNIARVNSQTERIFGFARVELLGKPIEVLIPGRYREQHIGHRDRFLASPGVRPMGLGLELFGLRSDGTEFPVEISLSPLATEEGSYVIAAIRDITERKLTDEKIQTLNRQLHAKIEDLAASNRELEAFSYSISHDLRAPLRQIDGFSRILMEDAPPDLSPELRDCLQQIRQGMRHMGALVDDLLNFARLGRKELLRQTVDMNALTRSVVAEFKYEIRDRDVRWSVGDLPSANCDSVLMRQVLRNLIANAVKFTRTRDTAVVEIGSQPVDGQEAFFVRDNGVGFDMKYAGKLFGVFQRLHLQEDFEGTGVGLAIVQRIIQKHHGRVWAQSEAGRGSAFFFMLGSPAEDERLQEQ